ncbi:hypothetical protein IFO70_13660 [Phormidium tenue FACHB-886]|nr:hypothetical protein [Phormidium tenue FACHB-886]
MAVLSQHLSQRQVDRLKTLPENSVEGRTMSEQPMRCRIPLAWQLQLEAIAQRSGQSVEQLIYQAIGQFLGQAEGNRVEPAALDALQSLDEVKLQLLTLTTRVAMLERSVGVQADTARVGSPISTPEDEAPDDEIEDEPDEIMISFLESADFQERVQQAIAPSLSSHQSLTYEDIENEPDEILYDFLEP